MNRIGDHIRNRGMNYTVENIVWSPDSSIPTIVLRRDFDHALFSAHVSHVRHFTTLKRIADKRNANLDPYDALDRINEAYRRITPIKIV